MLSVIDFRNGRYQGQVSKNLPHGVGIFMHISLTFVVAEWMNGRIQGHAMIVYPDSSIFCGKLSEGKASGLCLYELEHDHVKLITYGKQNEQARIVAISPVFNLLLQIRQFQQEKLQIIAEYQYSPADHSSKKSTLGKCLGIQNMVSNWQTYENCFNFFRECFVDRYNDLFEQMIITINGYKELWMGFREAGLGIRLQPLEIGDDNRCVRSQAYRIRMMGVVSKENVLCGMGYRTLDDALKGLIFEEGVYALPQTLSTYDSPAQRPAVCSQNIANHLKRSLFFRNDYLEVGWLQQNSKLMKLCHSDIFGEEQERIAQFVIENPNNDQKVMASIELKRRIKEESRIERELQKERARPTYKKTDIEHPSIQLSIIKQQIYRSISRKKSTSNLPASPNRHQTLPQPQPQSSIAYIPPKSSIQTVRRQRQESPSRKTGIITPRKRTPLNRTAHSRDLSTEGCSTGKITKFDTSKPNTISPILKSPTKNIFDNTNQKKVVFKPIPKDAGLNGLEVLPAKRLSPAKRPIQPLIQKDSRKKILTQNVFI